MKYKLDFLEREYLYFVDNCGFTLNELEVLKYKRKGFSVIEISQKMNISDSTVKRITKNIMDKIVKVI